MILNKRLVFLRSNTRRKDFKKRILNLFFEQLKKRKIKVVKDQSSLLNVFLNSSSSTRFSINLKLSAKQKIKEGLPLSLQ